MDRIEQCMDSLKKLRGLPPYNISSNPCIGNSRFCLAIIEEEFTREEILEASRRLEQLDQEVHIVTIKLPKFEGYELDGGEQPRIPKNGEFYLEGDFTKLDEAEFNYKHIKKFVYRKKDPEYVTGSSIVDGKNGFLRQVDFVEIKAIEDALSLRRTSDSMNPEELKLFFKLQKLLNENKKDTD